MLFLKAKALHAAARRVRKWQSGLLRPEPAEIKSNDTFAPADALYPFERDARNVRETRVLPRRSPVGWNFFHPDVIGCYVTKLFGAVSFSRPEILIGEIGNE